MLHFFPLFPFLLILLFFCKYTNIDRDRDEPQAYDSFCVALDKLAHVKSDVSFRFRFVAAGSDWVSSVDFYGEDDEERFLDAVTVLLRMCLQSQFSPDVLWNWDFCSEYNCFQSSWWYFTRCLEIVIHFEPICSRHIWNKACLPLPPPLSLPSFSPRRTVWEEDEEEEELESPQSALERLRDASMKAWEEPL